jgi:hypothetical protein
MAFVSTVCVLPPHLSPVSLNFFPPAAKHVNDDFWGSFCARAGVFCMGEVYGDDITLASQYQGPGTLDSILNYPVYDALVDAFKVPGDANTTGLALIHDAMKAHFSDVTVLGNFLENQDLPRWHSLSIDPQSLLCVLPVLYDWLWSCDWFLFTPAMPWFSTSCLTVFLSSTMGKSSGSLVLLIL